jgi:hypothetical protein
LLEKQTKCNTKAAISNEYGSLLFYMMKHCIQAPGTEHHVCYVCSVPGWAGGLIRLIRRPPTSHVLTVCRVFVVHVSVNAPGTLGRLLMSEKVSVSFHLIIGKIQFFVNTKMLNCQNLMIKSFPSFYRQVFIYVWIHIFRVPGWNTRLLRELHPRID